MILFSENVARPEMKVVFLAVIRLTASAQLTPKFVLG